MTLSHQLKVQLVELSLSTIQSIATTIQQHGSNPEDLGRRPGHIRHVLYGVSQDGDVALFVMNISKK